MWVLMRVVVGPGGAKLQAFKQLHVLPGRSQANLSSEDPRSSRYQLEPASSDRIEIILLRHGDMITSPDATHSLVCIDRAPKVQVNSSATELAQDKTIGETNGVQEGPEDETEDESAPIRTVTEVPVTQTVTQPSKSQPPATPHLPKDKSLVVHETPTISRMVGVDDYEVADPNDSHELAPTPEEIIAVTETFSTARTGHSLTDVVHDSAHTGPVAERKRTQSSPEVRVHDRRGKKRTSTEWSSDQELERSTGGRSVKRGRRVTSDDHGGDDRHAKPSDIVSVDTSCITHSTKRKSRPKIISDATPTKSSRSSQRSGTATTAAAYEGDPPQVATSNSAIKEGSSAVKFLRKHGGAHLSAVDDKCNVLWYVTQGCLFSKRPVS